MEEVLKLQERGVHELMTNWEDAVAFARLLFRDGTSSEVGVFEKKLRQDVGE